MKNDEQIEVYTPPVEKKVDPKDKLIKELIDQLNARNEDIKTLLLKIEDRNAGTIENGLVIESIKENLGAQVQCITDSIRNIPKPIDQTPMIKEAINSGISANMEISSNNQDVLRELTQKIEQKPLRFDINRNNDGNITAIIPVYARS